MILGDAVTFGRAIAGCPKVIRGKENYSGVGQPTNKLL
jgi:hypothetical protein